MKGFSIAAVALALGLAAAAPSAMAAACTGPAPTGLDTSDVTLLGSDSDACAGLYTSPVNDSLTAVNAGTGVLGGGWEFGVKSDGGTTGTGSYFGVTWEVQADPVKSDTWTLVLADPPPTSVTLDLMIVLKGGTGWAAYLFDNETLSVPSSNTGTFEITFRNNGGQIPNLSHLTVYMRDAFDPCAEGGCGGKVPEPSTILLLGAGLGSIALLRRRRRD